MTTLMREAGLQSLPSGRVCGFDVKGSVQVTCLGGEVWVTGPGLGDRVLLAGEQLDVVGTGRVVVEALETAQIWVRPQALTAEPRYAAERRTA